MNDRNAGLIMSMIKIKCPICTNKFKYRVNLKHHLKKEHTDMEAEQIFYVLEKNIKEL